MILKLPQLGDIFECLPSGTLREVQFTGLDYIGTNVETLNSVLFWKSCFVNNIINGFIKPVTGWKL